jgi:hypothetical protein
MQRFQTSNATVLPVVVGSPGAIGGAHTKMRIQFPPVI